MLDSLKFWHYFKIRHFLTTQEQKEASLISKPNSITITRFKKTEIDEHLTVLHTGGGFYELFRWQKNYLFSSLRTRQLCNIMHTFTSEATTQFTSIIYGVITFFQLDLKPVLSH